jgi:membrane protease subunit (stomatin/prohibitin family)
MRDLPLPLLACVTAAAAAAAAPLLPNDFCLACGCGFRATLPSAAACL